ncbi:MULTISPECIES: hypothetical protein [Streptomyces]|uniref:Uncharacterized protein n=2 Tax=Streptomyces TaxID=1883 RepID=A0ABV9ITK1_9ACTN
MSTSASPASLQVGAAGPPPSGSGERRAPGAVLLGSFTIGTGAATVVPSSPALLRETFLPHIRFRPPPPPRARARVNAGP